MKREDYRAYPAINNSTLADFYTYGRNVPEPIEEKYEFWLGRCFEELVRLKYDDNLKELSFFPVDNLSKRVTDALISGEKLTIRYKKDGDVYKDDADILNQWTIVQNRQKLPIDSEDFDLIEKTFNNLLTMPVIGDTTVEDFLSCAEFDVPVLWKEGKQEYKALFDVVSTLETEDGGKITVVFDLKYYSNPYGFFTMYRNKLWIQERHYTRANEFYAAEKGSEPYYCMPFLVGYKDTGLTQLNMIDDDNLERAQAKYDDLLADYLGWMKEDKKPTGHLPPRFLKVW